VIDMPADYKSEPLLQFFEYGHLVPNLQAVSQPFQFLAMQVIEKCPRNPERTVALRKLLEAKDCAVRALVYKSGVEFTMSAEPSGGTIAVFSGFPELKAPIRVTRNDDQMISISDANGPVAPTPVSEKS
jgi:hypothetical protein